MIVALEGPNGAGKTTLMRGYAALHPDILCRLCVPDIYMDCHDMKSYMLFEASALGSAFYFLSGLFEAKREDEKAGNSKILIDRSIWSTFATAYAKDEDSIKPLFKVLNAIQDYIHLPDETVVLRASYETCTQRSGKKSAGKEFDKDTLKQFNKKMEFYTILKQQGYQVSFIETDNRDKNEVLSVFSDLIAW
jgi:thymidylate kinase